MMVTYPFQGIDLDSEDSEYDAYTFYQLLEQKTSHSHILVEDIRVIEPQTKGGNKNNFMTLVFLLPFFCR